jgi:hypothetical protein
MKKLLFSLCIGFFAVQAQAEAQRVLETMQSAAEKADLVIDLAKRGDYGRLSQTRINMLTESRNRIVELAAEHKTFAEMDEQEQRVFANARERLNRLTQADNKDRIVCKRVVRTGTRFTDSECLTVAQRERRAEGSRARAASAQGQICNAEALLCSGDPGGTN